MGRVHVFSDNLRIDRIKGLLRPEADPKPDRIEVNSYPNPANLIPAQAAEIKGAYEAALKTPLAFRARHLVLALLLYRFGYNPRRIRNALPLAEWVLKSYRRAHPEPMPE